MKKRYVKRRKNRIKKKKKMRKKHRPLIYANGIVQTKHLIYFQRKKERNKKQKKKTTKKYKWLATTPYGFNVRVTVIYNAFDLNYRAFDMVNGSFDAPNLFLA